MHSTTEITSNEIVSDGPIHERLLFAYIRAAEEVSGDLLELGCGVGRGIETLRDRVRSYTAVDKIDFLVEDLRRRYPEVTFLVANIPPFSGIADNTYDTVVSFQVIEHIRHDRFFLEEIRRVLKPGGKAILTTPNRKLSLSRNPWHEREYTPGELRGLAAAVFGSARTRLMGVAGNQKVMDYHEKNRRSVQKIMRWDIFDLQNRLPASWLRVPYDFLNRRNRQKLMSENQRLVTGITWQDYSLDDNPEGCLDLFLVVTKE